MPYGVSNELWRRLPPDDQAAVKAEALGQPIPQIGPYAPTPADPSPPPTLSGTSSSGKPGGVPTIAPKATKAAIAAGKTPDSVKNTLAAQEAKKGKVKSQPAPAKKLATPAVQLGKNKLNEANTNRRPENEGRTTKTQATKANTKKPDEPQLIRTGRNGSDQQTHRSSGPPTRLSSKPDKHPYRIPASIENAADSFHHRDTRILLHATPARALRQTTKASTMKSAEPRFGRGPSLLDARGGRGGPLPGTKPSSGSIFGYAFHVVEHGVEHATQNAKHLASRAARYSYHAELGAARADLHAASNVFHTEVRIAQTVYHAEVRGLREAIKLEKLTIHEVYKHADDIAAGLALAGLVAGGILAPEAVIPALLFGGSDLLSLAGAVKAVSGKHKDWSRFALDLSSVGLSGLADATEREARGIEHLSGTARSEYRALTEVNLRDAEQPVTDAAVQRAINSAIGVHRASRISSEQIRRAVFVERLVSTMLTTEGSMTNVSAADRYHH